MLGLRRMILPVPVTLYRLAMDFFVFCMVEKAAEESTSARVVKRFFKKKTPSPCVVVTDVRRVNLQTAVGGGEFRKLLR